MNALEPYFVAYENEINKAENLIRERGKPFNLQEIANDVGNLTENGQPKSKYVFAFGLTDLHVLVVTFCQ